MGDSLSRSWRGTADPLELPFVSIIVETTTWHDRGHVLLADSLAALRGQRYPADRLEIIVVLAPENEQRWAALAPRWPGVVAVHAPAGLSLYQLKGRGVRQARGDVVAFVDADNWVGPDWVSEIVRPFALDNRVVAVHGPIHFRRSFLSRMWDAVWWSRAYEAEGPIDRVYASNNVAFRRRTFEDHFYDDPNRHRGVWERVMTYRLQAAAGIIWFAPPAVLLHDFSPSLGYFSRRALSRGYTFMAVRLEFPLRHDRLLLPIRWLAPFILFPGLALKDVWRIVSRSCLDWRSWWHVPLYLVTYLPFSIIVLAGMVMAAWRFPAIAPP